MRNQASGGEQGGPGGERWEQARRGKQASSRLSDYEGVILYGIEVLKPMQLNLRWVFFVLFWKQYVKWWNPGGLRKTELWWIS